jgi:hypothetical protein
MSDDALIGEFRGAWDGLTAHNRDFQARTPMGEPAFTKWREEAQPKIARVQELQSELKGRGYGFVVRDGRLVIVDRE